MRKRDLERMQRIHYKFSVKDPAYTALVYGLSKGFRTQAREVVEVLTSEGLPPSLQDLSCSNPYFYRSAVEELESRFESRRSLDCKGLCRPKRERAPRHLDLREYLQAG
jgi:hypothetical protein